jgi:hypothetical protein
MGENMNLESARRERVWNNTTHRIRLARVRILSAILRLLQQVTNSQGNGPIRHVETYPDFCFTARVHTTKSTVKILAANTHCK